MQVGSISDGQKHTAAAVLRGLRAQLPEGPLLGLLLGPIAGLVLWWLPLGLEPVAHRAIAIVGLMLVYWMTEAIDHGLTALMGCLLFWLLHVAPPAVAFSGFSTPTPWFMLGGLLIGQAASQTGLAKRLGYYAVYAGQGLANVGAAGLHHPHVCAEPAAVVLRSAVATLALSPSGWWRPRAAVSQQHGKRVVSDRSAM